MKHLFNHLPKLAAVAAIALGMSSCNRAEYAMLPKTTPYHATYHGTAKQAPASVASAEKAAITQTPVTVVEDKNTASEVAAVAPATVAPTVAATAPASAVATKPAVAAKASTAASAPRKLNLTQRLALSAVTKKLNKATDKLQIKQRSETAEASKLQGKLRQGIILVLVGLLIEILAAAVGSSIIYLLGALLILVGLILIVLYLLDEL